MPRKETKPPVETSKPEVLLPQPLSEVPSAKPPVIFTDYASI